MILPRGESYGVRIYRKDQTPFWVGTFRWKDYGGKREALKAAKAAEVAALKTRPKSTLKLGEFIDRYLDDYREANKDSSYATARSALTTFKHDHGHRPLDDETWEQVDCDGWAREHRSAVPPVVTAMNRAVERRDIALSFNPFKGMSKKGKGRKDKTPLSAADVDKLAAIARRLSGWFGPTMEGLIRFAATTGMRPGELFALEWSDIDFERKRIKVSRRVYKGSVRLPKNGRIREIALTPEARDALLLVPRQGERVFNARRGGMLSQSGLSREWTPVANNFGERADKNGVMATVDFYEMRHRCAYWLYVEKGLHERIVAEQLGHTDGGKLIRDLYGHGDHGALEEIDRAFEDNVTPLRGVKSA